MSKYYLRAISSPFGQKVRAFYTSTSKQVGDIHEEARRISAERKPATSATGTDAAATAQSGGPPDPVAQAAPTIV